MLFSCFTVVPPRKQLVPSLSLSLSLLHGSRDLAFIIKLRDGCEQVLTKNLVLII
jgi:hypothetical protein